MSRTIQVRDVPDEIHAELRRRAAAADTSLSDYVRDELIRAARRSSNAEVLMRAAARTWSITGVSAAELVDDGRADRE